MEGLLPKGSAKWVVANFVKVHLAKGQVNPRGKPDWQAIIMRTCTVTEGGDMEDLGQNITLGYHIHHIMHTGFG